MSSSHAEDGTSTTKKNVVMEEADATITSTKTTDGGSDSQPKDVERQQSQDPIEIEPFEPSKETDEQQQQNHLPQQQQLIKEEGEERKEEHQQDDIDQEQDNRLVQFPQEQKQQEQEQDQGQRQGMEEEEQKQQQQQQKPSPCEGQTKCISSCAAQGRVCPVAAKAAASKACEAVRDVRNQSSILTTENKDGGNTTTTTTNEKMIENAVPIQDLRKNNVQQLNLSDIIMGSKLGEGGFSNVNVCTIKKHVLSMAKKKNNSNHNNHTLVQQQSQNRKQELLIQLNKQQQVDDGVLLHYEDFSEFGDDNELCPFDRSSTNYDDDNNEEKDEEEYAIKYLKPQIMLNKRHFMHGISDLIIEANLLSVLNHPNIIKIHAITAGNLYNNVCKGTEGCFFIVVDRLYETLEKKIEFWRKEKNSDATTNNATTTTGSAAKIKQIQKLKRRLSDSFDYDKRATTIHNPQQHQPPQQQTTPQQIKKSGILSRISNQVLTISAHNNSRSDADYSNNKIMSPMEKKQFLLLLEKIYIALSIANAIEYLHEKNIIFRDLKPDNIGFTDHNRVKLFDFGLAKELKTQNQLYDGRYKLTGNTGSRRYMAPEVAKDIPYNLSVDAYSFGILFWEVLTTEKPFYGFSSGKHMSMVVIGGERPKMDHARTSSWPMNIQWLITRCWATYPNDRPSFTSIKKTLSEEYEALNTILSATETEITTGEQATPRIVTPPKKTKLPKRSASTDDLPCDTTTPINTGKNRQRKSKIENSFRYLTDIVSIGGSHASERGFSLPPDLPSQQRSSFVSPPLGGFSALRWKVGGGSGVQRYNSTGSASISPPPPLSTKHRRAKTLGFIKSKTRRSTTNLNIIPDTEGGDPTASSSSSKPARRNSTTFLRTKSKTWGFK